MRKNNLLYWSITVALAGFLFGFDTIVISGADQPIQQLWNTSSQFHGIFIMSMALWGTVVGALLGGIPCDRFGRKKTLFWIGILYAVSAIGSGLATGPYMFSFFRFLGGLGVGASSVAAPIYISEIAPAKQRGQLGALYQFNIVFGILVAYLSNYLLGTFLEENAWRWMLGVEGIPALIYTLMVLGVPKSPRWLILKRNDVAQASATLKILNPGRDVEELIQEVRNSVKSSLKKERFFSKKYSFPILLAFLVAFFNQVSGINFVLYYAPRIFSQAGVAAESALGASISIGIMNLIFTLLGMFLIDRVGRKQLLLIGSFGYILTLSGVVWAFATGAEGFIVVAFISAFVGAHALGQGAVIWVYISEVFPNKVRDYGMSLGASTHWIFAALITMITLPVLEAFSAVAIFSFFTLMMVFQLLFVIFVMPETKGVALEELQKKLIREE